VFAADAARRWVSNEVDLDAASEEVVDDLAAYAKTFVDALPRTPEVREPPATGGKHGKSRQPPPQKRAKRGSGNPARRAAQERSSPPAGKSGQSANGAEAFGVGPSTGKDAADVPAGFELPKDLKGLI
jgi:signal recognition particle subunit SRP54